MNVKAGHSPLVLTVASLSVLNLIAGVWWWITVERLENGSARLAEKMAVIHLARPKHIPFDVSPVLEKGEKFTRDYHKASVSTRASYNQLVAERRRVRAIVNLARNVDDFPVQNGNEIVANSYHPDGNSQTAFWPSDNREKDPVRMLFFLPDSLNRLICEVSTIRRKKNGSVKSKDSTAFEFAARPGTVNDFLCSFRKSDAAAEQVLTLILNGEQQTKTLPKGKLRYRTSNVAFRRCYPNQRITPGSAHGESAWRSTLLGRNEIFNHKFSLDGWKEDVTITVTCRIPAAGPDSHCAMTVAANNQSFIDRVMVNRANAFHIADATEELRCSITDIFEPHDESGLLYSRGTINLHPKRSH